MRREGASEVEVLTRRLFRQSLATLGAIAVGAAAIGVWGAVDADLSGPMWGVGLALTSLAGATVGWFLFRADGRSYRRTGRRGAHLARDRGAWIIVALVVIGGAVVRFAADSLPALPLHALLGWLLFGAVVAGLVQPEHRAAMRGVARQRAEERLSSETEIRSWVRGERTPDADGGVHGEPPVR